MPKLYRFKQTADAFGMLFFVYLLSRRLRLKKKNLLEPDSFNWNLRRRNSNRIVCKVHIAHSQQFSEHFKLIEFFLWSKTLSADTQTYTTLQTEVYVYV